MHHPEILRQVASLHAEGLKGGFLSSLGTEFLTLLYQAIDENENSILIVEMDGDRVSGFVAGGSGMKPIYMRMLSHFPQLLVALAPQLLSFAKIRGILEIMLQSKGANSESQNTRLPGHELLSIVVAPGYRGKGISEQLYQRLCAYFTERHIASFRILVGKELDTAHRFYLRMGAKAEYETSFHKDTVSTVYVHHLWGDRTVK